MNLLIYATLANDASKRLIEVVAGLTEKENTEIFNTLDSLTSRLVKLRRAQTVVVLLGATEKEVSDALSFSKFFHEYKLILILPDRDEQTMSMGHRLFPRYVSYADSDFSDVGAVLKKMIANNRNGERIHWQQLDRMKKEDQEGCLS